MVSKNYSALLIICCLIVHESFAAQKPEIKIINGTMGKKGSEGKAVAFSLVRTKRGSKYKELYIPEKPKQEGMMAAAKAAVTEAWNTIKRSINVHILLAPDKQGVKEEVAIHNFPQKLVPGTKLFEYDRALWIVPIEKLDKLVSSLKNKKITDSSVVAFEIGSALTAEIVDKNGKFDVKTTGKWLEGAKALINSLAEEEANEWPAEENSLSLANLTETKIKELQSKYSAKKQAFTSAANKAQQREIAEKYGR